MTYEFAFEAWGVSLPDQLVKLQSVEAGSCVEVNGEMIPVPWPPLSPSEIADTAAIATDWEIPADCVPVMGDFHDLVCVLFASDPPEVVLLNDARQTLAHFSSIGAFLAAITLCPDKPADTRGIIAAESWLDF